MPALPWGRLLHEVFAGKSIVLLIGGLVIGWVAGADGIKPLDRLFVDLFKGVLAFFLLEMGWSWPGVSATCGRAGAFLLLFAVAMPVAAGLLGIVTANLIELFCRWCSAACHALRQCVVHRGTGRDASPPEANPALSIGAALGVTFLFKHRRRHPLYYWACVRLQGVV